MLTYEETENLDDLSITYYSRTGRPFKIVDFAKNAQACCIRNVIYINIEPTLDAPALTKWVMEERLFIQCMRTQK